MWRNRSLCIFSWTISQIFITFFCWCWLDIKVYVFANSIVCSFHVNLFPEFSEALCDFPTQTYLCSQSTIYGTFHQYHKRPSPVTSNCKDWRTPNNVNYCALHMRLSRYANLIREWIYLLSVYNEHYVMHRGLILVNPRRPLIQKRIRIWYKDNPKGLAIKIGYSCIQLRAAGNPSHPIYFD